ncbi:hypothetical protein ACLK1T_01395 [Escherichia coli]
MINSDFNNVLPVDLVDPQQVPEFVDHAWYRYPNDRRASSVRWHHRPVVEPRRCQRQRYQRSAAE